MRARDTRPGRSRAQPFVAPCVRDSGEPPLRHAPPGLQARDPEDVVRAPRLAQRGRRTRVVEVTWVEQRVVGNLRQTLREAAIDLVLVAPGKVGSPATLQEERVSRHEPSLHEEALAPRRVTGGVDEADLDRADRHDVAALAQVEVAARHPGHAPDPLPFLALAMDLDPRLLEQLA